MASFTDRVNALKGLHGLGALNDEQLEEETSAILKEMRASCSSSPSTPPPVQGPPPSQESPASIVEGSLPPSSPTESLVVPESPPEAGKATRKRPDEAYTPTVATWLSQQVKNVLAQHKEHTGHGPSRYSHEPATMWENQDLNARFTSLIAKASTKHPDVDRSWKRLIDTRLEAWANVPIQKAMRAGRIPKPTDGKKRALNNKTNRQLAAVWEEEIAERERQAATAERAAKRCRVEETTSPAVATTAPQPAVAAAAEEKSCAAIAAGVSICHAWNGKGYFPEDPTKVGVMEGSPGLVYNAMIVQKDEDSDGWRIIFNSCETVYVASLRQEDEGKWWWYGHQEKDGKTTADKLIKKKK